MKVSRGLFLFAVPGSHFCFLWACRLPENFGKIGVEEFNFKPSFLSLRTYHSITFLICIQNGRTAKRKEWKDVDGTPYEEQTKRRQLSDGNFHRRRNNIRDSRFNWLERIGFIFQFDSCVQLCLKYQNEVQRFEVHRLEFGRSSDQWVIKLCNVICSVLDSVLRFGTYILAFYQLVERKNENVVL